MGDRSLLNRAAEFRKASGSELAGLEGFSFDKDSGISREDQRDILRHIDKVAKSSRILAGPDTWKVKPKRRGILLPLAVNLVGLAVLAGGIVGLRAIIKTGEAEADSGAKLVASAEGRLLQEIKREAEGRIQEKDREISKIQERMAALDKERVQLLSSVETKIKAKEAELRAQLDAELEKERQRLLAEGLSESAVQERLKEFERKKSEEFRTQLDAFSKQAEAEKTALQANLDRAKDEFKKSLSDATSERQRIQDESRAKEQALREQLGEKDKALEAERAKAAESLQSARAELAKLNEAAARDKAAEDRLLGLYASARQALRDGRLDDAAKTLEALRSYLSDPQASSIPSLRARRELDLFAVDLIERTIGAERAKTGADANRVTAALEALAGVRAEADRARAALAAGDRPTAAAAYRRALGATKELEEAGTFLDEYWKAAVDAQSALRESELRARAQDARSALAAIDASARDDKASAEAFARYFSSLSIDPELAARAYARIKESGRAEGEAARRQSDTAQAAAPLRAAASDLSAERYLEALAGYAAILSRFPAADQAAAAAEGLREAGRGLASAFDDARAKAAARIAELEASLNEARARLTASEERAAGAEARAAEAGSAASTGAAELTARAADLERRLAASDSSLASLREELAAVRAELETAKAQAQAQAAGAPSSAEYRALEAQKAEVESELAAARARYDALTSAYRDYAAAEDRILEGGGDMAEVEARARLDSFLAGGPAQATMPGLRERVARYLNAFQAAGQKEVLFNAADIVDGAARIQDPATRARYFADLEARYAGDRTMLEFLSTVKGSFR